MPEPGDAIGAEHREMRQRDATPQLTLPMTLFMFAWPAAWYLFVIYVLIQPFIPTGGVVPTWAFLAVVALGTAAEGLVGLLLLRWEGYRLTPGALRDRIRWRWPRGWRAWGFGVAALVAALALSVAASSINRSLAETPAFTPPSWWPAVSNPLVEVKGVADAMPDIGLKGNFGFVALYLVVGLVNVFGEEIYYRGYLLPRMRGVFGRWDWVANGVLFTLKHVYQRWLYPGILVGGLAFGLAAGPLGSLPLAIAFHWIGNFLLSTIALVAAAFGIS